MLSVFGSVFECHSHGRFFSFSFYSNNMTACKTEIGQVEAVCQELILCYTAIFIYLFTIFI